MKTNKAVKATCFQVKTKCKTLRTIATNHGHRLNITFALTERYSYEHKLRPTLCDSEDVSTLVVKTPVTTYNSPSQHYTDQDDQPTTNRTTTTTTTTTTKLIFIISASVTKFQNLERKWGLDIRDNKTKSF